jgi:hypothetical protein
MIFSVHTATSTRRRRLDSEPESSPACRVSQATRSIAMMQGRLASFTEARYAQLDTPIILIWHSR